jgi:hypothetical protein
MAHLVHIRTSQRLYLALGSSTWSLKHEAQLQRAKFREENLREKQNDVTETLLIEAGKVKSARGRIEQLEAAMSDLQQKQTRNTREYQREEPNWANEMEMFQKQLTAATNDYDRVSKPWRDAVRLDDDFRRQIANAELWTRQTAESSCNYLDIERVLGAFLKPSEWRMLKSYRG